MRTQLVAMVVAASIAAPAQTPNVAPKAARAVVSAPAAERGSAELPVRKVVLYKNGVGYFEHFGRVRGTQELEIKFTTSQLNDVLKSLTVVDLGGGQVTGVRYNSIAPLAQRLSTLRVQLGEDASREDFLNAMRGARVEVRNGSASAVGRLLSVEERKRTDPRTNATYSTYELAVMTDAGELRTFELTPATSVRFTEPELNREVARYMSLIASSRAKDVRQMTIGTSGEGDRNVAVSYISEVPVWKSTYRVVLPEKAGEKALLQGWAIVDNTVGEDWNNVQLTLVAGAPQSFVQQISQPLYMRRPTVALSTSALLTPQTHEGTLNAMNAIAPPPPMAAPVAGGMSGGIIGGYVERKSVGQRGTRFEAGGVPSNQAAVRGQVLDPSGAVVANAVVTIRNSGTGEQRSAQTDSQGNYTFYNLQPGNYSVSMNAAGFQERRENVMARAGGVTHSDAMLNVGATAETVEVSAASDAMEEITADDLASSMAEVAEGGEIGDLFQYALKQKITVLQNQSALVPIVQSRIDADKVTIWNESDKVALRALWLKNSSGLTLDGGTFNIIESNAFAGEGVLKEIKPDERRLLSYAADTAVRVKVAHEASEQPYTRIRVAKGLLTLTREQRESRTYTIRNSDTMDKNVIIEHPARNGWKFADKITPEESTESYHRFRVPVAAGKTADFKVAEFHPEDSVYALTNLTSDQVVYITRGRNLDPRLEAAFRQILGKKNEISSVDAQLNRNRVELERISRDQQRLRENMKALKGSAEEKSLTQRYVTQLNQQEDRLAELTKQINDLDAQRARFVGELDLIAQAVTVDEGM